MNTPGHGPENLWQYWLHGQGATKIAWGTPRDYTRCVALLAAYLPANEVAGYCAKLHHAANGYWPGDKQNT